VEIGVSVGAGRAVPDAPGVAEPDTEAACAASAAASLVSAFKSFGIDPAPTAEVGLAAAPACTRVPGSELAGVAADGPAAPGCRAAIGVTGCTAAGGPAENAGLAGAACEPPTGGTGVTASGDAVAVGVSPTNDELTICRPASDDTAVGEGFAAGADPMAPLASSTAAPIPPARMNAPPAYITRFH